MEPGAITIHEAQRIPREDIAAVIADGLDRGGAAEQHALPGAEACDLAGQDEGEDIEKEGLEPVGVDGAVGVGDVDAVVLGVHKPV